MLWVELKSIGYDEHYLITVLILLSSLQVIS